MATASRRVHVSAERAWACVTDVRNHARWIPLTRMHAAADLRVGDTFAGISGPRFPPGMALVDRMRIERLDAPTATSAGVAVYRKLGPVLLGTAEVRVQRGNDSECTVTWVEHVHLRGLPPRLTAPILDAFLAAMSRIALRQMAAELTG
jgi:hypothetical protein